MADTSHGGGFFQPGVRGGLILRIRLKRSGVGLGGIPEASDGWQGIGQAWSRLVPGLLEHGQRVGQFVAIGGGVVHPRQLFGATASHHIGPQLHKDTTGARKEICPYLDKGWQGPTRGTGSQAFRGGSVKLSL